MNKTASLVCLSALTAAAALTGIAPAGERPAAKSESAATAFKIDPVHSSVIFRIRHMNVANFYGRFDEMTGTVGWDDSAPTELNIELKTASVNTGNEKRDQHLRSPDFFDVKQFPRAAFRSTSIRKASEHEYEVAGDLTLHGVTRPLTAVLTHTGTAPGRQGGQLMGLETTFTVKRSDFGITFMPGGLGEDVQLTISIEAGS